MRHYDSTISPLFSDVPFPEIEILAIIGNLFCKIKIRNVVSLLGLPSIIQPVVDVRKVGVMRVEPSDENIADVFRWITCRL